MLRFSEQLKTQENALNDARTNKLNRSLFGEMTMTKIRKFVSNVTKIITHEKLKIILILNFNLKSVCLVRYKQIRAFS